MYKKSIGLVPAVVLGLGLFTGVAFANIVSGQSTTGASTDITYTQLALSKPADATTAGDFLLATVAVNGGSASVITPPAGWTLVARTDNSTNISVATYYKVVGASEPSTYAWNISPATRAEGGITHYSGVNGTNPIDVTSGSTGTGNTATAPSVTTTGANEQVVAIYAIDAGLTNTGHFSVPTGMTEKYDVANAPIGPSVAADDKAQATAGASGATASSIATLLPKDWAAQTIALKMQNVITENFESYAAGTTLNGQNGGTGWTGPWASDTGYVVENTVAGEGSNAVEVSQASLLSNPNHIIKRSFGALTAGTIHWRQRKDAQDDAQDFEVYSGNTEVMTVGIGSSYQPQPGGPEWFISGPGTYAIIQPYTVGQWDTVDVQFDTATGLYRASIDGAPYTAWMQFENPATSVDAIRFEIGGSGYDVGNNYYDDVQITGN